MEPSIGLEEATEFWEKPGVGAKSLGMAGYTGEPPPKGAVAIAMEEYGPSVASSVCQAEPEIGVFL